MKMTALICLAMAIAIPELALAKLPFDNSMFGKVEATLDVCSQADPSSASKYEAKKKELVEGVPEQEVAEARDTKEYKDSYEEAKTQLGKESKQDVLSACKAVLQSDKPAK